MRTGSKHFIAQAAAMIFALLLLLTFAIVLRMELRPRDMLHDAKPIAAVCGVRG